ncbi:MAG: hypothetical protein RL213_1260 [Bacteroidota bacterium]|jgi:ketosteroid isomerase-like protein
MRTHFLLLALTGFSLAACSPKDTDSRAGNAATADSSLKAANDAFYAALNANFIGNTVPLEEIWSHGDDVSDQGPFGARLDGWKAVNDEFLKEGAMKLGGKVICKDLILRHGTDMGYTACIEEGENMSADGKPVVVRFRATNIFRKENGQWKMVHHHTDISKPLEEATDTDNDKK